MRGQSKGGGGGGVGGGGGLGGGGGGVGGVGGGGGGGGGVVGGGGVLRFFLGFLGSGRLRVVVGGFCSCCGWFGLGVLGVKKGPAEETGAKREPREDTRQIGRTESSSKPSPRQACERLS